MKNLTLSYLLAAMGLLTPVAGLHRFYLNKPFSGILFFLTWGFFGVGTVIDILRMQTLVENANIKFLLRSNLYQNVMQDKYKKFSNHDHIILKIAKEHGGIVTAPMVVINSNFNLSEASIHLNKLSKSGFCKKDIDEDGSEIFIFTGLSPKNPLI